MKAVWVFLTTLIPSNWRLQLRGIYNIKIVDSDIEIKISIESAILQVVENLFNTSK